jgi:hypothetical protein
VLTASTATKACRFPQAKPLHYSQVLSLRESPWCLHTQQAATVHHTAAGTWACVKFVVITTLHKDKSSVLNIAFDMFFERIFTGLIFTIFENLKIISYNLRVFKFYGITKF